LTAFVGPAVPSSPFVARLAEESVLVCHILALHLRPDLAGLEFAVENVVGKLGDLVERAPGG
jgi:hypothetical protein